MNPRPGILRLSVYRLRSGFSLVDESPLTRVPIDEPSLRIHLFAGRRAKRLA